MNRVKRNKKQIRFRVMGMVLVTILVLPLTACGGKEQSNVDSTSGVRNSQVAEDVNPSSGEDAANRIESAIYEVDPVEYSEAELDETWEESDCVKIEFAENGIQISGAEEKEDALQVVDNHITITTAGSYLLTGSSADASILVDCAEDAEVRLIFQNLELNATDTAPLAVKQAGEVIVTLAEGSENHLSDLGRGVAPEEEDADWSAVLHCKSTDLTINGTGTLTVDAEYKNAIKCKKELKIVSGTYVINAANDGLAGDDLVAIRDGVLTITAVDDGVCSDVKLVIDDGDINILQCEEGLEAMEVAINGGKVALVSNDDGINASSDDDIGCVIVINGGDVYVDASGDGLDANGYIYMYDGKVVVEGSENGDNAALDYDNDFVLAGGDLMAAGAAAMAQTPGNASSQRTLVYTSSKGQIAAGSVFEIKNDEGESVLSLTLSKNYQNVVCSSAEFEEGKTYAVAIDDTEIVRAELVDLITWVNESGVTQPAGGFGRPGGMGDFGGPGGQRPEGEMPEGGWKGGEMPQMPEGFGGRQRPEEERPEGFDGQRPEGEPGAMPGRPSGTEEGEQESGEV